MTLGQHDRLCHDFVMIEHHDEDDDGPSIWNFYINTKFVLYYLPIYGTGIIYLSKDTHARCCSRSVVTGQTYKKPLSYRWYSDKSRNRRCFEKSIKWLCAIIATIITAIVNHHKHNHNHQNQPSHYDPGLYVHMT